MLKQLALMISLVCTPYVASAAPDESCNGSAKDAVLDAGATI
jgi:hypothetical protein